MFYFKADIAVSMVTAGGHFLKSQSLSLRISSYTVLLLHQAYLRTAI